MEQVVFLFCTHTHVLQMQVCVVVLQPGHCSLQVVQLCWWRLGTKQPSAVQSPVWQNVSSGTRACQVGLCRCGQLLPRYMVPWPMQRFSVARRVGIHMSAQGATHNKMGCAQPGGTALPACWGGEGQRCWRVELWALRHNQLVPLWWVIQRHMAMQVHAGHPAVCAGTSGCTAVCHAAAKGLKCPYLVQTVHPAGYILPVLMTTQHSDGHAVDTAAQVALLLAHVISHSGTMVAADAGAPGGWLAACGVVSKLK